MNRREYLALLGTGITSSVTGCVGTEISGTGELIEDSIEGEGSSLREYEIVNDGAVFFEAEADERLSVSVIPEAEDANHGSFTLESVLSRMKVHRELEPGNYALEIDCDGEWSIGVEQHPLVEDADTPDFPLVIESNTRDVFGPFEFDGIMHLTTYTTVPAAGVKFVGGSGDSGNLIGHSQPREEQDHGSVTIEGTYWVSVTMNLHGSIDEDDVLEFEAIFEQPD